MPFKDKRSPFDAPNYDVFAPARLSDQRGIIEGAPLDGPQHFIPWIGLTTVRELALKHAAATGLVDGNAYDELDEKYVSALGQISRLEARVRELEAFKQNLAGLRIHGFNVQKKQGPQIKPEEVEV